MAKLVLVRHGQSEWNKLGKWTGLTDVSLTESGREEARRAGRVLKDVPLVHTFTSALKRAEETLHGMFDEWKLTLSYTKSAALNERDYGIHTGKNKWEVKEEIGEEAFQRIRRGWDAPIPEGETLKDVHARVVPYYEEVIFPHLSSGANTLIVAHGNSLRALMKRLENISDADIPNLEFGTGAVYLYDIGQDGGILGKTVEQSSEIP